MPSFIGRLIDACHTRTAVSEPKTIQTLFHLPLMSYMCYKTDLVFLWPNAAGSLSTRRDRRHSNDLDHPAKRFNTVPGAATMRILTVTALGLLLTAGAIGCQDDTSADGNSTSNNGGSGADGGGGSGATGNSTTGGKGGTNPCDTPGEENTEEACSNGCDDDNNGFEDCDDFECSGTRACAGPVENSNPACADGVDNDGNGFTDCDDFGCQERAVCILEETNFNCQDGEDNDGDNLVDCQDEDCQTEGIVVCNGPVPANPMPAASEWQALSNAECTNTVDEDANGFTDCGDFSCQNNWEVSMCKDLPPEGSNATCSDGMDNDKDGDTDCDDQRCQGEGVSVCDGTTPVTPPDPTAASNTKCSDNLDNNNDGTYTDCDDFGCSQNPDVTVCNNESNDTTCSDRMDNNGNTFVDCDDFSCSQNKFVTVCMGETTFAQCSDSTDNDGNNFVDCDDFSCNPPNGTVNPACR